MKNLLDLASANWATPTRVLGVGLEPTLTIVIYKEEENNKELRGAGELPTPHCVRQRSIMEW